MVKYTDIDALSGQFPIYIMTKEECKIKCNLIPPSTYNLMYVATVTIWGSENAI